MKTKQIAVVGSGYWGKNLIRNFSILGGLHTICDSNPDVLQTFKEQYPEVTHVPSYHEILSNDQVSGIAIATPAYTHASMAKEALLAGKDVYVEKPLCLTESEGRDLTRIAREENLILMVGHLLWYHPAILKLKKLIDNGGLGRIQYIYSNRLNLGKLRREENVLWSFAPHDVSIILGLLNEMPETIRAQGGNFLHQQIADTTVTLLNFSSGIRAHIFVSWLHPFKEQKLVVVGEKQMAVFDDTEDWEQKLVLYPHSINWTGNVPVAHKAEACPVALKEEEPLRAECAHFIHCITERIRPRTDGEEGLRVLKVLNGCQKSLEKKLSVSLTDKGHDSDFFSHETACIDKNVTVGNKTKVWHFSHILSGSTIGRECSIGQNVVIGPNVTLGKKCKIQNNVSIYEGVELEDEVFCGPSMVFTNVVNPRSAISRKKEFMRTIVRKGVTIGANATIICGVELGEHSFIAAGAVVTGDTPAFALVKGNPAQQVGWMSRFGERIPLPLDGDGDFTCPQTGVKYTLKNGEMRVENVPAK